jgi:hypothetical protein
LGGLFAFIFQIGSHIFDQASLEPNPPIYTSYPPGITNMTHCAWLLGWDRISLFTKAHSSWSPSHWDYRHRPLYQASVSYWRQKTCVKTCLFPFSEKIPVNFGREEYVPLPYITVQHSWA